MQNPIKRKGRPRNKVPQKASMKEPEQEEEIPQEQVREDDQPVDTQPKVPQEVPETPQPSREDLVKNYKNEGEFRYDILKAFVTYANGILSLTAQTNKLLERQNKLADEKNDLLAEQNDLMKPETN